jgi:hypothetical protein
MKQHRNGHKIHRKQGSNSELRTTSPCHEHSENSDVHRDVDPRPVQRHGAFTAHLLIDYISQFHQQPGILTVKPGSLRLMQET